VLDLARTRRGVALTALRTIDDTRPFAILEAALPGG
jgi:hypothetical protein